MLWKNYGYNPQAVAELLLEQINPGWREQIHETFKKELEQTYKTYKKELEQTYYKTYKKELEQQTIYSLSSGWPQNQWGCKIPAPGWLVWFDLVGWIGCLIYVSCIPSFFSCDRALLLQYKCRISFILTFRVDPLPPMKRSGQCEFFLLRLSTLVYDYIHMTLYMT